MPESRRTFPELPKMNIEELMGAHTTEQVAEMHAGLAELQSDSSMPKPSGLALSIEDADWYPPSPDEEKVN